ncbi:MAG: ATP-binding cassette domain-containing protein, partial [Lachnospiraceae bacterium]|nr:ATP-binding cassette domain-containing protein [Lachnospiraceae bacterium]
MNKKPLIDLVHITKSFDGACVLDDMSLSIHENEFLTLLGPSGCGKTTTLRILGGFVQPDQGKVIFDGQDITQVPPNKRNLNTVFQKYSLFPHMNVEENIAFGLKIRHKSDAYIRDKISYALKLVNLDGYEKRMPSLLTAGRNTRYHSPRPSSINPKLNLRKDRLPARDG